jgi:hypothetical protein
MMKRKRLDHHNQCAFCSVRTITRKNQTRYLYKKFKEDLGYGGLNCTQPHCGSPRLICKLCIVAVVKTAKEKNDPHILADPWIDALRKYVDTINLCAVTTEDVQQKFKGHCCDFNVKEMKKEEAAKSLAEQQAGPMAYDGGLVLLGHGILIETDCNAVDVNAMGADALAGINKGIVHGVIDPLLARQLHMDQYAPKAKDRNFRTEIHDIVVPSVLESGQGQKVRHYAIGTNANILWTNILWTHFLS